VTVPRRGRVRSPIVNIYSRSGDDGTTGLFYGGRVRKDGAGPEAYGTVDEAVSALGTARAVADEGLARRIVDVQRELFVVAAELATGVENRGKLTDGVSRVTDSMVRSLEERIDDVVAAAGLPTEFVVPGGTPVAAGLDLARSVVRRAERRAVTLVDTWGITDSRVVAYLNRLADYLYVLARAAEGTWLPSRHEEEHT
jgi:cob(I)alamin adenosyltransferase